MLGLAWRLYNYGRWARDRIVMAAHAAWHVIVYRHDQRNH